MGDLFSSLMVATAVSVSGIVGFVGLIVPHCIRLLMGPDNRRLLPCAFVLGGIFLVYAIRWPERSPRRRKSRWAWLPLCWARRILLRW
jgi:hypothetical protein